MLGSLRLNDSLDEGQFWPWLHAHLSTFVGDRRVVIRANDAHSLFCIFDPLIFGRGRRIFPFPFRRYPTPIPFTFPWPSDERRRRVVASEPYRWLSCPGLLAWFFVSFAGCRQEGVLTSIMLLLNENIAGQSAFRMNDVCICVSIETIGTEVRGVAESRSLAGVSRNFCVRICALSVP